MLYRYGFVNFRSLAHLEYFARERLGQKWGMFMSDKVLQVRQYRPIVEDVQLTGIAP